MAETGQYIYMGSNRNFLYNVVRQVFGDGELSKLATNIIFKGDIATDTTDFSGKVIRYDKNQRNLKLLIVQKLHLMVKLTKTLTEVV